METIEDDTATLDYYEYMAEMHEMDTEGKTWTSIVNEFCEEYTEKYGPITSYDELMERSR